MTITMTDVEALEAALEPELPCEDITNWQRCTKPARYRLYTRCASNPAWHAGSMNCRQHRRKWMRWFRDPTHHRLYCRCTGTPVDLLDLRFERLS